MSEPSGAGARTYTSADPGRDTTSTGPDPRIPGRTKPGGAVSTHVAPATSPVASDTPGSSRAHDEGPTPTARSVRAADSADTNDSTDGAETEHTERDEAQHDVEHSDARPAAGTGPRRASRDDVLAAAQLSALVRLRDAVTRAELPFDVEGVAEARERRRQLLDQLDDYVLPRLVQLEAPTLAVVGGSTGAGKSTLVNSLVGRVVSEPGVLRPTTRSPVLVHHPDDAEWFTDDRILPGMRRLSDRALGGRDPGALRLVADEVIPPGLAVLDAPDVDSLVKENRDVAAQLLAAADLWVFVTTATRYSDAVPWRFLADAAQNSTAVAMVLDRIPPDRYGDGADLIHPDTDGPSYTVAGHLGHLLTEAGLHDSPLFSLPESALDDQGLLPAQVVRPLLDWLRNLADDEAARGVVVRTTLAGAIRSVGVRAPELLPAITAQQEVADALVAAVERAYADAVERADVRTQNASLLSGEVLARWQEFVGTGALLQGLDKQVGRVRDWVRTTLSSSSPAPGAELSEAIATAVRAAITDEAERAAAEASRAWRADEPGRKVLAGGDRDLARASRSFDAQCARAVLDWQQKTYALVREAAGDRRSGARFATYGVNGLGVAAMVVALAGGAGAKARATGSTAADVGRQVLRSVLGAARADEVVGGVRTDLTTRIADLLASDAERFATALTEFAVEPGATDRVAAAAAALEDRG